MAFDSPPAYMDSTTLDAEVFRRALATLIAPAGGIVTPGDLNVTQQVVPNMSVLVGVGEVWVPGSSTPSQGPYYSRNGAPDTLPISASNPSNPRIDTVIVQVEDAAYAGVNKDIKPDVVTGTATSGANLTNLTGAGALPASSYVLAYVLVPALATSVVTADIKNVASHLRSSLAGNVGAVNIPGSQSTSSTSYTVLATPDQIAGVVLPANGLIAVWYQATWQETVSGAAAAAIFLGVNQLKIVQNQTANGPVVTFAESGAPPANQNLSLFSFPGGLASTTVVTNYSGDATTGQVVGASGGVSVPNTAVRDTIGGPCYIFAAAGTYTVSVAFKASSGSVSAAGRKLWVQAIPFS